MRNEKNFKYITKERRQEVEEIFQILQIDSPLHNYRTENEYYDINKPFKKISLLKYEGFSFKFTRNS